jgi:hypothetical protein
MKIKKKVSGGQTGAERAALVLLSGILEPQLTGWNNIKPTSGRLCLMTLPKYIAHTAKLNSIRL